MIGPSLFDEELLARGGALVQLYRGLGLKLASAESCTGGLLSALLTETPGSSAVLERAFVTYSNESKQELLRVPLAVLEKHGAVSRAVAQAMAEGALAASHAHVSISITGIAGPDGGSAEKPVGLVWFACAFGGVDPLVEERRFEPRGRTFIRRAAVLCALDLLEKRVR